MICVWVHWFFILLMSVVDILYCIFHFIHCIFSFRASLWFFFYDFCLPVELLILSMCFFSWFHWVVYLCYLIACLTSLKQLFWICCQFVDLHFFEISYWKVRDLFKKIRDTTGTFHAKMGSIKDRNGRDLTEQKILRRGGKNTQKNCTKKIFTTQIITMVWSLT